jgi:hypothetical protein
MTVVNNQRPEAESTGPAEAALTNSVLLHMMTKRGEQLQPNLSTSGVSPAMNSFYLHDQKARES